MVVEMVLIDDVSLCNGTNAAIVIHILTRSSIYD